MAAFNVVTVTAGNQSAKQTSLADSVLITPISGAFKILHDNAGAVGEDAISSSDGTFKNSSGALELKFGTGWEFVIEPVNGDCVVGVAL